MRSWIVALLLVLPGVTGAEEIADPPQLPEEVDEIEEETSPESTTEDAESPPGPKQGEVSRTARWTNLLRVEAATWALLPREGMGRDEGYFQVEPTLVFERRPEFGVNLGTPLRLRVWGPKEGGVVRREDWDTLSDWGQLVRSLKLGSDNSPLGVWFGKLDSYSLLNGHLVRRYAHCVLRTIPITFSGASRTPSPGQAEHRFRSKPNTDSGASRTPVAG
ncbi:hypothetical protein [Myxococcus sp. AB025B]|uniref:hypothetical protein n=1 Tax=Myxococcus sp. AB025B TaxID=2562794 RepID=UPI001142A47B|nr:hypothetical protein [Myxococcus sp. AB025B]